MDPDKGTLILLEILSLLADYVNWNEILYNSTFTCETHEKVLFFPIFFLCFCHRALIQTYVVISIQSFFFYNFSLNQHT